MTLNDLERRNSPCLNRYNHPLTFCLNDPHLVSMSALVIIMSIGTKPHFKREAVRDTAGRD